MPYLLTVLEKLYVITVQGTNNRFKHANSSLRRSEHTDERT